ncbi:hypothetical protein KIPB_004281 [Kipferlia bialata]|uniref:Uncharacterized protein n=1 Tax=Kipferlia bialata TaxID=797122 RepID=A0A391NKI9_9EUKA|nr:hypothetical protein KIPB_004281 [Kipferlia bialata]|eukprot:g4281.t1
MLYRTGLTAEVNVLSTLGKNECPADLWSVLDSEALAADYDAEAVIFNGPRYMLADTVKIPVELPFVTLDDLELQELGLGQMKLWELTSLTSPYTDFTLRWESVHVYNSGRRVYELESPLGDTYRMVSYCLLVDSELDVETLSTLGVGLSLPEGWSYSTRTLGQEEALDSHTVVRLQDSYQNTYQRI